MLRLMELRNRFLLSKAIGSDPPSLGCAARRMLREMGDMARHPGTRQPGTKLSGVNDVKALNMRRNVNAVNIY